MVIVCEIVENLVGKAENAGYKVFKRLFCQGGWNRDWTVW